jgi:hypothetical protein
MCTTRSDATPDNTSVFIACAEVPDVNANCRALCELEILQSLACMIPIGYSRLEQRRIFGSLWQASARLQKVMCSAVLVLILNRSQRAARTAHSR